MKNKFRWILVTYFLGIIIFLSTINTVLGAKPTIGEIKLTPAHPAPKSDVTFKTDISGGSVSEVRLIISECDKERGVCHVPRNLSMNKISGNTYEKKVTLEWDEVTSITYHINLESDGKWIDYDEYTTKLSTNSDSNNDTNGSPGFEIIVLLIAIIGILIFKKFK